MFGDRASSSPLEVRPLDVYVGPFGHPTGIQTVVAVNRAHYAKFVVRNQITVSNVRIAIGATSAGNVDVAIVDAATLARLASTGSTPVAAANAQQDIPLTAPVTLYPGVVYWALLAATNITCIFATHAVGPTPSSTLLAISGLVGRNGTADEFPIPATVLPPLHDGSRLYLTWFF